MAAENLAAAIHGESAPASANRSVTLAVYDGAVNIKEFMEALSAEESLIVLNASQEPLAQGAWNGFPIRSASDYVSAALRTKVVEDSYRLAQSWYEDLPAWFHCDEGICFGEVVAYDVGILFIDALSAVAAASSVIAKEQPKEIILPESKSLAVRAFEHMARTRGVNCRKIACSRKASPASLLPEASLITPRHFLTAALWGRLRDIARTMTRAKINQKPLRILATDYFRLKPVMERLQKSGMASVWFLGGSPEMLRRSLFWSGKTGSLAALGYLSLSEWFSSLRFSEEITNHWHGFLTKMAHRFNWQGINLLDIIATDLGRYVQTAFPNLKALLKANCSLIEKEQITCIAVHQDLQGYHKLLVECGKKLKRRTICFQHGIDPDIAWYGRHTAGEYAVWGKSTEALCRRREKIGRQGRVTVVGDPFLVKARQRFDREAVRKRFGCFANQKLIVFPCERFVNHYAAYDTPQTANRHLQAVCQVVNQLPGGLLVARCKMPRVYSEFGGDFETKRAILKQELPHRFFVDTQSPLHELLSAADVVIVTYSTIGLEAMALNRPVIYLNFEGPGSDLMGYEASGAVLVAHSQDQLQKALSDALNNAESASKAAKETFVLNHLANFHDADCLQSIEAYLTGSGK